MLYCKSPPTDDRFSVKNVYRSDRDSFEELLFVHRSTSRLI